jgi:L-alanine-DL-glutamate epimerase-like enolase superfamily enzyme
LPFPQAYRAASAQFAAPHAYKLAMGAVSTFDTILIEATDSDGHRGWGEATILTGYT